ncbi:MAG: flavodoxin family protein [Desulfobacterales bacterium]
MLKVLALLASPRKLGNCEIMAKAIDQSIPQAHTTRYLRLHDFKIKPCIGCYRCLFKTRRCILDDDLAIIVDAMADADALLLLVPAYFLGANGLLKVLLDRGLSFYGRGRDLWGKPALGVGIAGIPGKEGATLLGIENFLKLTLCRIKVLEIVYGALPGEIFFLERNRVLAKRLGRALMAPADRAPTAPSCPVCGGTTFRFLDAAQAQCMLCSNSGPVTHDDQGLAFQIQPSDHEFFRSIQDAQEHEQWLQEMKQRFVAYKKELKQISSAYRKGEWSWVQPPSGQEG